MQTVDFLGVPVVATSRDRAVDELIRRASGGGPADAYRLVNAYSMALAEGDTSYKALLSGPGVNLPDGRPLAYVLRKTSRDVRVCEQVRGPSFFEAVIDRGREHGIRHFFLGTTDETLNALVAAINREFPGAQVAGVLAPPFRPLTHEDHERHDQEISASGAHIVWVGMGTPRQDFEARRVADSTGITSLGVGAAFDFTAGTKKTAPAWVQRLGLEWLHRMLSEPRRLTKRYVVGNSIFLRQSLRHWRHAR